MKLAKERAKKKTPYAVFDLRRNDEEESRAKVIADIDADNFQQSSFKSSRGDKNNADRASGEDTKPTVAASNHDDAIFGSGVTTSSGSGQKLKSEPKDSVAAS